MKTAGAAPFHTSPTLSHTPILLAAHRYRNAVLRAVGKYNRTEAPIVLQTARKALCLSEAAGEQVHAAVYDAQLALLLDDEKSSLSEDDMELLGELEGMLQVRGASAASNRLRDPTKARYHILSPSMVR